MAHPLALVLGLDACVACGADADVLDDAGNAYCASDADTILAGDSTCQWCGVPSLRGECRDCERERAQP